MESAGVTSETSIRRTKRGRVREASDGKSSSAAPEEDEEEREDSPMEFDQDSGDDVSLEEEEPAPKRKKRKGAGGGGTAAARMLDEGYSLIEVIKDNSQLIPSAVKQWVEHYEKDPKAAMAEILMMLFEACGARYQLDASSIDETDVDTVVLALVNLARNGEVEDRYSSKRKDFKNFKENLSMFWDNLVIECENGPLFDKVLFDKCTDYVIAMSCTPPRVYRQVASLVGLQLVTSFITVAKTLGGQRETTQRQLNAEKKKRNDGPRVESLSKRLSVTHEKITATEETMRKIFTGLFMHRYRDVDPEIRMSCIKALGTWIVSYPSLFLQDSYLKYLGWTLNDKIAGVRKTSVLALRSLYEVDDNVPSLGLFTERFSNRMIELADDIDIPVAVSAIGLLKQLLRHQLLTDDELGPLYDLLIDEPALVRRAIGELVYDHLIAQNVGSSRSGAEDNDESSEIHLGRMLQILREFPDDPILTSYVIDDVWDDMKAMKDWKCIISMLLDENRAFELTDVDQTNLIRVLCVSAKKAVGEKIVPSTDNRKVYHSKAQKEVFDNNRRELTAAMLNNYPQLLRKYASNKAKVSPLVEIMLLLKLELYSLKRQEQNFKAAVELICNAFFKHGDKDALRSCVKALTFCSTESQADLQDFARNKLKELEDELIAKLRSAMKEVTMGNDEYSLLVNLKRLHELQLTRHVLNDSLYEDMANILKSLHDLADEVMCFLLLNMYLNVAWCLHSIDSENPNETSVSALLSTRNTLFERLEYILNNLPQAKNGRNGNLLAARVCTILAEMWCLFKKSKYSSTKVEALGYHPNMPLLQKFWKLCEQQLNISDDTEDEDGNEEYIEETNREAVMIAAAKLVASNIISKEHFGPEIISHFVMHGAGVAEIIKHLISVIKKTSSDDIPSLFLEAVKRGINLIAPWMYLIFINEIQPLSLNNNNKIIMIKVCLFWVILLSLLAVGELLVLHGTEASVSFKYFEELAYRRHMVDFAADDELSARSYSECKDLASRLSASFVGVARSKHKSHILQIVKEGISFAFEEAPKQLSFLEVAVLPFVSKLPALDAVEILKDVQKRSDNINTDEDPSGWRPYHTFVEHLREKYAKNDGNQDDKELNVPRRRGRPRKERGLEGRKLFEGHDSSEEDSISGSEQSDHDNDDEDEEEQPLIHTFRSASKLRAVKLSEQGKKDKAGTSRSTGGR